MNSIQTEAIVIKTPLGAFRVEAQGKKIVTAAFCEQPVQDNSEHILKVAEKQLDQFFNHKRKRFQLPVAPHGTVFQQRVWLALERLNYGQTCTSTNLARQLGIPDRVRAVSQAVNRNPLAIIIPSHRVVDPEGKPTTFIWGRERQEWLLQLERSAVAA